MSYQEQNAWREKYAVRNDQSILAHAPMLVESQIPILVSQLLALESDSHFLVFAADLPCVCGLPERNKIPYYVAREL